MSKINLWNTISVAQTGRLKLQDSGRELFGTVIKHGVNDKTVTVRISSRIKNTRYIKWLYSNKSKQVHDELNYCVTGDKVIIANCAPITKAKTYYVKSIVKPFGRPITPKGETTDAVSFEEGVELQNAEEAKQREKQIFKETMFEIPTPIESTYISQVNLRNGSENPKRKEKKKSKSQIKEEKKSSKRDVSLKKRSSVKEIIEDETENNNSSVSKSDRENKSQKDASDKH